VRLAASEPIGPAPGTRGGSQLAELAAGLRDFGRRRRTLITVLGSLATAAVLALLLAGRRDEFAAALSGAAGWVLAATVLLQIVALLARSEAWHLTIQEAGGTVDRRVLYRASSMGVLGGLLNAQAAVAARIAALRPLLPGRQSAGADADRRGVSDPRRRGGAGRADVVHPGGAARPAVVAAAHLPCGDRRGQHRPAAARPPEGPRAVEGTRHRPQPAQRKPPDRLRAGGRVRRRSSATCCCCTRSVSTPRSSTPSPS
jgi:hypothetical protein